MRLKTVIAHNPKELSVIPKSWCRSMGPIVFESENDSGGHFYATERPEWLARDLKSMFGKGGACFGIVEGKNGYDGSLSRL
jgi:hypothetical protein